MSPGFENDGLVFDGSEDDFSTPFHSVLLPDVGDDHGRNLCSCFRFGGGAQTVGRPIAEAISETNLVPSSYRDASGKDLKSGHMSAM